MLTRRENQVLSLVAVGLTPDEIGNSLYISKETVRKTICNIKVKVHLQKAAELAAYYWCQAFGDSFEERKRQILSSVLAIIIILHCVSPEMMRTRRRISLSRRARIEFLITTEA